VGDPGVDVMQREEEDPSASLGLWTKNTLGRKLQVQVEHAVITNSVRLPIISYNQVKMELLCKDPLLTLFTRSVLQYPQHIAVEDGPQHTLTYQQLAEESTALARYLQAQGVQRGEIIPILTSTCVSMVVGILGIIQAGAIYVPVDRDRCPPGRIEYILRKTRAKTVLYTGAHVDVHSARAIALPVASDLPREDDRPLGCRDSDLLAIIFTSGTTNRPKGVQIRSSSVARLVSSPDFNYNITAGERVLLVLSVGFDGRLPPPTSDSETGVLIRCALFLHMLQPAWVHSSIPSATAAL
jgi:non-ribosomal peptide synthetase component F